MRAGRRERRETPPGGVRRGARAEGVGSAHRPTALCTSRGSPGACCLHPLSSSACAQSFPTVMRTVLVLVLGRRCRFHAPQHQRALIRMISPHSHEPPAARSPLAMQRSRSRPP